MARAQLLCSTTTALLASATYSSGWKQVTNRGAYPDYNYITGIGKADADAASAGLKVEWGHDGTNVQYTDSESPLADEEQCILLKVKSKYVRIRWVNGAGDQSSFALYIYAWINWGVGSCGG